MAMNATPTDEQVWKQVRKALSLDDEDETTPVPPFLFQPIKEFMLSNPDDDEFVVECSVPGRNDQPYGEVTCLEDLCYKDIHLKHDNRKADGGVSIGLGSFDPFREHCMESGHKKARDRRQEVRKKASLSREARKAREAAKNSTPPLSSRSNHHSSAMLAKSGSGSFSSLSERKPDIKRKPSALHVKSEVNFSNSKSKISAGPGGSKRPIFVLSDSDDDDDLQFKAKRLKPSSSATARGIKSSESDSDHENHAQKTLAQIISSRKAISPPPAALPLNLSSAVNSQPSTSQAQRTLDYYLKPGAHHLPSNSPIPDVKPAVPALNQMQVASSSAFPAVPSALAASGPVTHEELDTEEQIAMCRKAMALSPFVTFPAKINQLRQYLHYVGTCKGSNRPIAVKVVAWFPELAPYTQEVREAVRNVFRRQGRTLLDEPREAPSAMSMLSNSLAPQNLFPGMDFMGRMLDSAAGLFGEDAEEAAENRRLTSKNSDDLQTFFKDSLDNFSENVTVSEAATKLGLAHLNDLLPGMSLPLMPHQIIGVQWMIEKEKSKNHGGILADAMGLGKTVQTIATMIANPSTDPTCKTTLIVAPLALLEQWKLEIEHKTYGQLRVYIFHGPNKNITKKQLKKYDVVLTTYGTLVQQFPPPEKKEKTRKPNDFIDESAEDDDHEFTSNKVKHGPLALVYWYRVVLDEAAQIRNKRTRAAKACFELDALNRWVLSGTLIVNSLEDCFPYFHFLALSECAEWETFRKRIVTVEKKAPKPLLQLPEKVVHMAEEDFDEDERALYTAIEQKVKLRFNRYLRAGTVLKNMRNVLIMILRLRQVCAHATLIVRKPGEAGHHDDLLLEADDERLTNHKAFRDNSQIDRDDEVGRARVFGGDALVEKLKAKLALRQTEDQAQQANGEDGDFQCVICFEPFLDNERITSCLHSCCLTCITDITKKHQDEVDSGMAGPGAKAHCPMCRESIDGDNIFVAAAFEAEVVVKTDDVKAEQDLLDELDLGSLTRSKGKGKGRAMDFDQDEEEPIILPSAKMRKTSALVTDWLAANDEDKIVIFSQFVTFIELVREHLEGKGIECFTYTGSMSKVDRDATIANFTSPRNPVRVILISTKAGGVGLNLTIANKAICLDLAWNNATEQQAIDRIHRIGQTKPVEVHRIVIPNSVEQRILALQEKKAALAEGAYGEGKGGKLGRLSVQDLMALFDVRRDRDVEEL
ncbi:hypothetical protein QFC21_000822 [Naganishia friedmannii]|uniref:Uncharacterized protein n=1 Tax=Naganishia friedmannii TaxID=89922 RepID=A0ACC2W9U2_9TREE|nr:hypothetical protein QFC21_000822 [Naganishia friedmannii]